MANQMSSFLNDIVGIMRTPGATLGRSMSEKKWVPMLLLLVIAVGIFTYIYYPIQMKKMSEDAQMSGYMTEDQLAQYFQPTTFTRFFVSLTAGLMMTLSLVYVAFFVDLFYGIGGAEGMFINYFSLVTGASLIDVFFPRLLQTVSLVSGINLGAISNPLLLFSPDPKSLLFLIMARFDIFSLWYTIIIALGMVVYSKMTLKRSLTISLIYFLFKALIGVAFGFLVILLMG